MADEKEITTAAEEVPAAAEQVPAETVEEAPAAAEQVPAETVEEAPATAEQVPAKKEKNVKDNVLTVIGILLCVILAPILIANMTMIVKSLANSDEVPSFGGYCPFIVLTDSMADTINGGDLVIDKVVTDASVIQKGDIISFFDPASHEKSIVTHRVVEIVSDSDGIAFRTQGDANNAADDDVVPAKNVVGLYSAKISGAGNVIMFMQSTPGLIVCIALPIFLLIAYDYIRRSRFEKKQKADTAALMEELQALREQQKQQNNNKNQ